MHRKRDDPSKAKLIINTNQFKEKGKYYVNFVVHTIGK